MSEHTGTVFTREEFDETMGLFKKLFGLGLSVIGMTFAFQALGFGPAVFGEYWKLMAGLSGCLGFGCMALPFTLSKVPFLEIFKQFLTWFGDPAEGYNDYLNYWKSRVDKNRQ